MDGWTASAARPGYVTKVVQAGACTLVLHRPELSKEERARREKYTREALEPIMRDYYRTQKRKEQK